jgi:hypothetical protein
MGVSVRERGIYCHTVPGRMRLKQACWKGAPKRLGHAAKAVRDLPGVTETATNATTGSLLILFDPRQTRAEVLIAFLEERGEISPRADLLVSPASRTAATQANPLATLAWSAGSALGKEILKGALGHVLRDTPWSILLAVV